MISNKAVPAIRIAIALGAFLLGLYLAGVYPVENWAAAKRAANLAAAYHPNMDPGIAVALAAMMLAPFAVIVIVGDALRIVMKGAPLSMPAAGFLGALVGAPVAYSLVGTITSLSWWGHALVFAVSVAAFYGARAVFLRKPGVQK